eukprot:7023076-Alexandrium_andersonii.AAC.1
MDGQAAGHIHLRSAAPFVGPEGPAPVAPGVGQPDDGQLEEDLEAIIDEMGGVDQGLPGDGPVDQGDQQLNRLPQAAHPRHNRDGGESDSSD